MERRDRGTEEIQYNISSVFLSAGPAAAPVTELLTEEDEDEGRRGPRTGEKKKKKPRALIADGMRLRGAQDGFCGG